MDEELDILQDTTAEEDAFANSLIAADTGAEEGSSEGRLYDYTNSREVFDRFGNEAGSQNLYFGNFNTQVTEDELRELYEQPDNTRIRESFGTFENYLAYMNERQDLIDAGEYKADWWNTGEALVDEGTLSDRDASIDDKAFEREIMEEGARQGEIGYNEQADIFQDLYTKYTGESTTKYLDNGSRYEWNGTSFVMTQEAYGAHLGSILGEVIAKGIISGAATGGLASALNGLIPGITPSLSNQIADLAVNAMTGQDLNPADALSFAFNTLLPGSGEVIDDEIANNAIDQLVGVLTNPDNYIQNNDGTTTVVWDDIDYEGVEGEFDPDDPDNAYDPDLIDPQLPKLPTDDSGGGGGRGGGGRGGNTPTGGETPSDRDGDGIPDGEDQFPDDPNNGGSDGDGEFVYDPEHNHVYQGNGVFAEVDENGELTGRTYTDPDFEDYGEDEYPAEVGGMYSVPASYPEGPTEVETDGDGIPDLFGGPVVPPTGGPTPPPNVKPPTGGPTPPGGNGGNGGNGGGGNGGNGDDGDGSGDGSGDGDGDGNGDGDGFDLGLGGGGTTVGSPIPSQFDPFRQGLSYQPVQPLPLFSVPQRDFVADINVGMRAATPELDAKGHLDQLLEKYLKDTNSMFEGMI